MHVAMLLRYALLNVQVWRAKLDGTLPVAVKVLKAETLEAGAVKALLNEIDVLRAARHPNIVLFLG